MCSYLPRATWLISFRSLILCITVYTAGCNSKTQYIKWDNANFDPTISKNEVYRQMDREGEIFSFAEVQDTPIKRSSDVAYFINGSTDSPDSVFSKFDNCRAYFFNNDTLSITIGIGNRHGGLGFIVKYINKRFYTKPYYADDVWLPGEEEPVYELIYQRLTLDKPIYKLGDSLFGKIDFKSVETDMDKNKIVHMGQGYFRTKVKKL